MKRDSGFTLVELMITVAIAAILVTLVVPGANYWITNAGLTTQANNFVLAMNLGRVEAIKRGNNITLQARTVNTVQSWGNGWDLVEDGTLIQRFDADSGMSFQAAGSLLLYTFRSTGSLANVTAATTFHVCGASAGEFREIDIQPSGQVSVDSNSTTDCSGR